MSELDSPIPAHPLPVSARAPGKCIVFGEHAVVHGAPELLFALELTTQVVVRPAPGFSLNSDPDARAGHAYFREALEAGWSGGTGVEVRTVSHIPRGAGLGSSAAFCASLLVALGAARGGMTRPALAQRAFDVERSAQGVGSPGDTSASVAGGFLTLNSDAGEPLWKIEGGTAGWPVHRVDDPGWVWVVAHSGIPRSTADAVKAVGHRLAKPDGPELLKRFRSVAEEGISATADARRARVAELMTRNQELLREVGVSHPRLEALLAAAAPVAEGAKLTGAGAGGSIVVLPRPGREVELVRRLARAGGLAFVVRPSARGAELVPD